MKNFGLTTAFSAAVLLSVSTSSFSQEVISINIQKEVKNKNVEVVKREVSFIKDKAHPGIRLDARLEDGIAWLKNVEFSNGILEFDTRGQDIKQHSFVGIAFHGHDSTYEVIYLRPFNFKATEDPWRSRAVQYVSLPVNTWRMLREKFPNKYEGAIQPAPDPNSWVHMRIVVTDGTISTYINGNDSPSLVVNKLGERKTGSIGFYVADTSGGDFANLKITKTQ